MNSRIRPMQWKDRDAVIGMMRTFYSSPAVLSNGSEEIFASDFAHCIEGGPYLEGYVFEEDETILGYAMVAKSFSTEYGKPCVWIEDLYLKSEYRGEGTGSRFLRLLEEKYPGSVFRLEVEEENERAVRLYRQCGFDVLPYMEMKKVCSE